METQNKLTQIIFLYLKNNSELTDDTIILAGSNKRFRNSDVLRAILNG